MSTNCQTIPEAVLVGLDWGTTSLRAYLYGSDGSVLDTRFSKMGVMRLRKSSGTCEFNSAFESICGDWLNHGNLPVIAAGMVGSAQGWIEAPYVATPTACVPLTRRLVQVHTSGGALIHVIPGIIENGVMPNVMRGEETQIFGALGAYPALGQHRRALIGLPGTHAKWAFTVDGQVERFLTFMTGEIFGVLRDYTILGRSMHPSRERDDDAYLMGVDTAVKHGHAGVLATMFSTRTLGLTGRLSGEQQSDYLSGLLIGHELMGLANTLARENANLTDFSLGLIGDFELCERYSIALSHIGCDDVRILENTTERGLFHIACEAGLVS